MALDPAAYNVEATTADGSERLGVFRFDFSGRAGHALIVMTTGIPAAGNFSMVAVDATGALVEPELVTTSEPEASPPGTFVLHGNFPNPFSSNTALLVDLPMAAEVRVEVIDLLGRKVLVTPAQAIQAGPGSTMDVDAAMLAPGLYFCRVIARADDRTMAGVGRMILTR